MRDALVVGFTAVFVYLNTLQCGFVFDDESAVKTNKDIRPETPWLYLFRNDFWGTPMHLEKSHKSYRPLTVASFRLNYWLGELEPSGYHALNVVIHAAVCVLFLLVCQQVASRRLAFIAALLFAVHPIHTEAVASVVGRAELLSAAFCFASWLCYSAQNRVLFFISLCCIPLATLCKETGVTIAAVIFLDDIVRQPSRGRLLRITALIVTTIAVVVARLTLMPGMPHFSALDNPASHAPDLPRRLTFSYLPLVNTALLFYPWPLCADWALGTIPLVAAWSDSRVILMFLFYTCCACGGVAALLRRDAVSLTATALLVAPFIPATNLFIHVGFVVAERILYLPSAGFCLLVALGGSRLSRRFPSVPSAAIFCLLVSTLAARTWLRNADWIDQVTLFRSGLKQNQQNAKLFNNVGHTYEAAEDWPRALAHFRAAAVVHPTDLGAHQNVGRTLKRLGRVAAAEEAYRAALNLLPSRETMGGATTARVPPDHLNVFLELAALLVQLGREDEADSLFERVTKMRADYTLAYEKRGEIFFKKQNYVEAEKMYSIAWRLDQRCANCAYNLAVCLIEQRKDQHEVLPLLRATLLIDARHEQALLGLASFVQQYNVAAEYEFARDSLAARLPSFPERLKAVGYFQLALLESAMGSNDKAAEFYDESLRHDPNHSPSLFNMAWLEYKSRENPLGAQPWLERLLTLQPTHANGLLLFGYLHLNHTGDYRKAEELFYNVLQVDRGNGAAWSELCYTKQLQGRYKDALRCYTDLKSKLSEPDPQVDERLLDLQTKLAMDSSQPVG